MMFCGSSTRRRGGHGATVDAGGLEVGLDGTPGTDGRLVAVSQGVGQPGQEGPSASPAQCNRRQPFGSWRGPPRISLGVAVLGDPGPFIPRIALMRGDIVLSFYGPGAGDLTASPKKSGAILACRGNGDNAGQVLRAGEIDMVGDDSQMSTCTSLLIRLRQEPTDQGAWTEFVQRYGGMIRAWCQKWGLQAGRCRRREPERVAETGPPSAQLRV